MSMLGGYEECRTDCLCHDCKNRRNFHSPKGCIAYCGGCDGVSMESIPEYDYDTIGYKSKRTGCEFYEKEK